MNGSSCLQKTPSPTSKDVPVTLPPGRPRLAADGIGGAHHHDGDCLRGFHGRHGGRRTECHAHEIPGYW